MEAVPRLPVISIELRESSEDVEFSVKLKRYIKSHYGEEPALYETGLMLMDKMRKKAVFPGKSVEGVSLLKRYYCQLHFMASRFPMRENEEASVSFSWEPLHYSGGKCVSNDISLEMSSTLYNIGALHTQLGAADARITSEQMKLSCTHYQCAAWAFQHIHEKFPHCKRFGLSPVFLSYLCNLCLAQAQECILEKSMMDNRKAGITAKLAVSLVDYYTTALKLLQEWPQDEESPSNVTNMKSYKETEKYMEFKIAYYDCISLLFHGLQSEDQQKMGERVAFYQAASEKLKEATKLSPGQESPNSTEALAFLFDVIQGKKNAAKNENEFIYHEDVPNISHLTKLKGASLVKVIPFNINDPEVCGNDLFENIIPMKAHESASLYSEEKAKLLRKVNTEIENKDEELETFLSMLDLDEIKSKMDGNQLPQELIDRCAALNANTEAVPNLTKAMNKLADVYQDVESMLNEIKELLNEEENHEKEYQQAVGKRPPSIAATDLTREAKKYQEAHAKASESNETLHRAMIMHIPNLQLLSLPLKELMSHIPVATENPEVEGVTKEMLHLVSKVDEMKKQRIMLAGQLRDMAHQDDITNQVITYSGKKIEDLFEEELKKYDKCVSLIQQNLAAQDNILRAMKETYAKYGATRKNTGEVYRKRSAMISSLIASYDAYEDLCTKSSKGFDFYKKLETNVSKLLQRVKGTCKVQDEEREQMLKSVMKPEVPQLDAPPSNTLKLKDYLNIKKETGKLSLEQSNNVVPPTTYYNDPAMAPQTWIPGIRPAPVGSEETDTNMKNSADSFRGFYQGQGKDQIWANTFYSLPQNSEQKLKYYLPQNQNYQGYQPNSFPNQDLYPISSYSTSLPKTEGQGYEPKSNYYDVQTSPHRCYNPPPQSFNEAMAVSSNSSIASYTTDPGYTQGATYNQNSELPQQYGYTSQTTYPQGAVSQQPVPGYVPPNETNYVPSVVNQPVQNQVYNPAYQQSQPYTPTDPNQVSYSSASYGSYPTQSTAYNSYPQTQTPAYGTSTPDVSNVPNYSANYPNPSPSPMPNYPAPQDQIQNYQSVQNYQPVSSEPMPGYVTPQTGYNYNSVNPYMPQNSEVTQKQYMHPNMDTSQTSWQGAYPTNSQYFQSGNESLYTASQTPNNYAMINSDVYKTPETNGATYPTNQNYSNQYYTNQYGAYGQADINTQNGNSATYMQAGTDKQQTTTTYSNSEAKSSPVTNPSNVDLLAGLDFNISQSPLQPETKKEENVETAEKPKTPPKNPPECIKPNIMKEPNEEKLPPKDLMVNMENVTSFAQEVEKYEKFVEGLTLKTLNGPTSLDLKWKEIVDLQEKISPQHIISVARCYPMKNRFSDILPYDDSRVELPSTKDDYINASKMTGLTKLTPPFILTQAPLPSTYADFWAMVFEQQVEVIVCLLSDAELDGHTYWPSEKSQELEMGKLKISLQSNNVRTHWVERILSICVLETRMTRVVVHLQFTAWPGSSFPDSPGPFLSFSSECINFFMQQRSYNHPVVVHCMSGVGRTGLFCLIIASLLDIQAGKGLPDLASLAGRMCQFRKSCLRDREHLKFGYQAVLYYSQDYLMKRGILTNRPSFEDKKSKEGKCHTRHPSEDFLIPPSSDLNQLQAGVEHLEIDPRGKKEPEGKPLGGRSQSVCSSISCTSSGRSSPSSLPPDILSTLDSANFSLKVDPSEKKKKKFTPESFSKGPNMDSPNSNSDDPLSRLDPLWTMKK